MGEENNWKKYQNYGLTFVAGVIFTTILNKTSVGGTILTLFGSSNTTYSNNGNTNTTLGDIKFENNGNTNTKYDTKIETTIHTG
jgi:hypothetical protein